MAAFLVSILFQLLLLCLQHVSPCVSLSIHSVSPLGILRSCRQRLFPSSSSTIYTILGKGDTQYLARLFEAYDVIQDPSFRSSTSTSTSTRSTAEWKIFESITSDVEATAEGVVAGQGLVAKRSFQAGEVVALYPIHALGYNDNDGNAFSNNGIPIVHEPSQRRFPLLSSRTPMVSNMDDMDSMEMEEQAGNCNIIVGTSDLVCFKDEARQFGVTATNTDEEEHVSIPVDYSYAMLDPSERYVFDVNPSRTVSSMFVAHLVNDAAAADFSCCSHANENRTLEDFDETVVRTAVAYLDESLANFNVVMTPFGPPPLMAYVTVKPVDAGTEFLATYGLDYWLGKVDEDDDDDDDDDALYKRLFDVPRVRQKIDRADDIVFQALKGAKAAVRGQRYKSHTDLMGRTVADLMAPVEDVDVPALDIPAAPQGNINRRSRWWRWILPKGGAGLD
jgi:hypothetical protein